MMPPVGKAGNDVRKLVHGDFRIVDHRRNPVAHFGKVVRRHIGRHANGNAQRPVQKQVGKFRGQHFWLFVRPVIVRLEVDGILVDVEHHLFGDAGELCFRVTIGRRRVAVDRTKVSLAFHQRITQRKILGHADHGVIDRRVAMRVVLAKHVTDHVRAFAEFGRRTQPLVPHGIEDATMHRLQAVTDVGKRTIDDDGHGIIQKRRLDFFHQRLRIDLADHVGDKRLLVCGWHSLEKG
jgi:hypothetical protein